MNEKLFVVSGNPLEIKSLEFGISLRQFTVGDASAIFGLINRNRSHLSQFGDETASKYSDEKSVVDSITNPRNPKKLRFGIWNGKQLVGSINLTPDEGGEPKAEIGYYLGSEFTGNGYMGKAVKTLVAYGFSDLGYKTLFGNVHPDNVNSQAVLLKAGFVKTGTKENGDFVYTINK